jgi:hypothetical protein
MQNSARADLQAMAHVLRGRSIFVSESETTMRLPGCRKNHQNQRDEIRKISLTRLKNIKKRLVLANSDQKKLHELVLSFLSQKTRSRSFFSRSFARAERVWRAPNMFMHPSIRMNRSRE